MNTWIRKALQVGIIAAGIVLAGGAAAQASNSDNFTEDVTRDKPALVQDVAENVNIPVEDSIKNLNILGIAVQEVANDNEIPVNVSDNKILGAQEGGKHASSANNVED